MKSILPMRLGMMCLSELEARGFQLDTFDDFDAVHEFVASVGKGAVTPKMDPAMNDFTRDGCIWFSLSHDGQRYAVIGARLEDIGADGLEGYLMRSTNRHYGPGSVEYVASNEAIGISGRAAYIGELFVAENKRGRRGILRPFVLFVIATAAAQWQVDHVYGFFRARDVLARMPQHYGFTDCIPGVMSWGKKVDGRAGTEWLASISRPRIDHLAGLCLRDKYWITLQSKGSE